LFFHDAASLCRLHYSIDAGIGQTLLIHARGGQRVDGIAQQM
jgi:hypothetical protein